MFSVAAWIVRIVDIMSLVWWRIVTNRQTHIGDGRNFHLGAIVYEAWGRKFSSGVQRRSSDRGSGDRSWSSLQTLFTHFDCRNDRNLKISHNYLPPDSWPVRFTVGLNDIWGAYPQPMPVVAIVDPYKSKQCYFSCCFQFHVCIFVIH